MDALKDNSDKKFIDKLLLNVKSSDKPGWLKLFKKIKLTVKSELHLHIGGSMRPLTLKELTIQKVNTNFSVSNHLFGRDIEKEIIETNDLEHLTKLVEYRPSNGSLREYLKTYSLPMAVINSEEGFERTSYEAAVDNYVDGIRHLELRVKPIKNKGFDKITFIQIISSIVKGFKRAMRELDGLKCSIILTIAKNHSDREYLGFFSYLLNLKKERPDLWNFITGLDSSGKEEGFNPKEFEKLSLLAIDNGLKITCHAGESFNSLEEGINLINYAVDFYKAKRIGHGLAAAIPPELFLNKPDNYGKIYSPDRVKCLRDLQGNLLQKLSRKKILIESCPSSNIQTSAYLTEMSKHPLKRFLDNNVPVSICTDNTRISHTKLSWEIIKIIKALDLNVDDVEKMIDNSNKYNWF